MRAHNDRAWLAHTIAALGMRKHLPALHTLMIADTPLRPQSWQEKRAIMQSVLARVGAKPRPKRKA